MGNWPDFGPGEGGALLGGAPADFRGNGEAAEKWPRRAVSIREPAQNLPREGGCFWAARRRIFEETARPPKRGPGEPFSLRNWPDFGPGEGGVLLGGSPADFRGNGELSLKDATDGAFGFTPAAAAAAARAQRGARRPLGAISELSLKDATHGAFGFTPATAAAAAHAQRGAWRPVGAISELSLKDATDGAFGFTPAPAAAAAHAQRGAWRPVSAISELSLKTPHTAPSASTPRPLPPRAPTLTPLGMQHAQTTGHQVLRR